MNKIDYENNVRYMCRYSNNEWVDIVEFIEQVKQKHPNLTVHIGTDSQHTGNVSHYVTVVALRFNEKGAIALYKPFKYDKNGNRLKVKGFRCKRRRRGNKKNKKGKNVTAIEDRLRRETDLSIEVASYLSNECGIKIKKIDLDYNSSDGGSSNFTVVDNNGDFTEKKVAINISNNVLRYGLGYCKGMQFEVTVKPKLQVAIPFADKLCRKY